MKDEVIIDFSNDDAIYNLKKIQLDQIQKKSETVRLEFTLPLRV